MKKIILCFFLLISFGIQSQSLPKTYTISAVSNPEYEVLHISNTIKRLLFIRCKGDIILPEYGYYVDLSKKDADKIGVETITYIPLDGERYFDDEAKEIHETVNKLSPNDYIFYSKEDKWRRPSIRPSIFTHPSLKDTIGYYEISNADNMQCTSQWISVLENTSEVVVEGTGCAKTTTGGRSFTTYSKEKICDLAKQHLHYLNYLFPETSDEWTKKQWETWFLNLMKFREPLDSECNAQVWNQERYFNPNYIWTGKYYTETQSKITARIEMVPSENDYKDQQLIFFDQKEGKYYIYDLHTEEQPFHETISNFVLKGNHIYILTESLKWVDFTYNKLKDKYQKVGEKDILPENFFKNMGRVAITDSYCNDNLFFVLFTKGEDDITQYYVASFSTQTGQLINCKSFPEIFEKTQLASLKDFDFHNLKYANHDQNYWVLALNKKKEQKSYFLKISDDLEEVNCIQSQVVFDWHENILTTPTEIIHVRNFRGDLQRHIYDNMLSQFKKTIHTDIQDEKDDLMDEDYIVKDGNSIRVIVGYEGTYSDGFKQKKVGLYDNSVEESCVYSYIPHGEFSEEKKLFYVGPNNLGSWTVFMKDDSVLRIANVR